MTDLQTILEAIDDLPAEDLERVRQHVDERQMLDEKSSEEDIEDWIIGLHAAIDAFREGLSDDELRNIVNDMNIGYISPKKLAILEQLGVDEDVES